MDGFIVTENGPYVGLGTGDQLVRSVTEARIEAARHANPLTFLPGNISISQHIERLLKKQVHFVACYADLNHFKPYNGYYGYWRGDEMIRLMARLAMEQCDTQRDFLGHVGGTGQARCQAQRPGLGSARGMTLPSAACKWRRRRRHCTPQISSMPLQTMSAKPRISACKDSSNAMAAA